MEITWALELTHMVIHVPLTPTVPPLLTVIITVQHMVDTVMTMDITDTAPVIKVGVVHFL